MPQKPKITEKEMKDILKRYSKGESLRSISEDYPITHQALSKRMKSFAIIQQKLPSKVATIDTITNNINKISSDQIRSAYRLLTGKSTRKTIAIDRDKIIAFLRCVEDDGSIIEL